MGKTGKTGRTVDKKKCLKWSKMVKVGLKWYKMIQNGPKWSNMIKYDLIWSNRVQILSLRSSKWARHNQVSWSSFYYKLIHNLRLKLQQRMLLQKTG